MSPAHPVQQHRHPLRRVRHPKPLQDQIGDPRQRPVLIGIPERRRSRVQQLFQQPPLGLLQPARLTARPLGQQRPATTGLPGPPPPPGRHRRHLKDPRHPQIRRPLLKHPGGLEPDPLTRGPLPRGQTAALPVPHNTGLPPNRPGVDPSHRQITPLIETL